MRLNNLSNIKYLLLLFFILLTSYSFAQNRGNVWCFGDSALVDFSDTSNIVTGTSALTSEGSCASICDSTGSLLFYAGTQYDSIFNGVYEGKIFNSNHVLMTNGDSIRMYKGFQTLVIVDVPSIPGQYIVFSVVISSFGASGVYYSVVDMNANGGVGAVVQKNIQIDNYTFITDCLAAVKHGNGIDWWILYRRWYPGPNPSNPTNEWFSFLVTSTGITQMPMQNVGSLRDGGNQIVFNSTGDKMCFIGATGIIETYDFDRCNGIISNPTTVNNAQIYPGTWPKNRSVEFSPSGNLLYVSQYANSPGDSSYLMQFDLNASNIAQSSDTIMSGTFWQNFGQLKIAPDKKIYMTVFPNYPNNDTTNGNMNINLTVINSPDSIGSVCNIQPHSFNLGGNRTYLGLPNNPDYDLGPLSGSPCDTLVGIQEQLISISNNSELFIYYSPEWQAAFINAKNLSGKNFRLEIFDTMGKRVLSETGSLSSSYFTKNLSCEMFANGMYIVKLETEKERFVKRFIRE